MEEHQPIESSSKSSDSITLKKDTLWKVGTFVFAALFLISIFGGGFSLGGNGGTGTGNAIAPTQAPTAPTGNIKVPVDYNEDPVLGDEDAGITIVEFSDFQCPFCQRAADGAVADFKNSDYFSDGEVNLVYKHFPLNSIHPQAQKAAEASECARRQGNDKFWDYHDALFANQQSLDEASLKSYAQQIGLNTGDFNSCLDGNEARDKVNEDTKTATASGGRGTPYFVVINNDNGNTQTVSGAVPWANFEAAINSV